MIERQQLLNAVLGNRNVTNVDIRKITLDPGITAGRHLHPCAVVGFIASGTAFYQVEGEAAQRLDEGSAFYEPAGKVIVDFGNASDTEPMTFIAFYLLDGDQELITTLDKE